MLTLRTLGTLALERDGESIAGAASQRKPLAILAVLAASGSKGIPRERIESLFWPDSDGEKPRRTLNQYLYQLRRDLGEPEVIVGSSILSLNNRIIATDYFEFSRAIDEGRFSEAVDVYAGPYLDGVTFPRLDELDRVISATRDALNSRYVSVLKELAQHATRAKDHTEAAKWWGRLAAHDRYSSQVALRYMEALEKSGEREKAIRHAEISERILKSDLGAAVSNDVLEFAARLRRDSSRARVPQQSGNDSSSVPLTGAEPSIQPTPRVDDGPSDNQISDAKNSRARARMWGVAAIAVLMATVAIGLTVQGLGARKEKRPSPSRESIVVIPFDNETGDKSLDAIGLMGAEWITDGLSRINLLPVIDSRTAAATITDLRRGHQGRTYSIPDVGRATGATNVITGGFFKRGDTLEFHSRIVDSRSGNVLGAIQPIAVPLSGVSKGIGVLRSNVLSLLAKMFDSRIAQVTFRDAMPPNLDAYSEFVAGVDSWAKEAVMGESDTAMATRHDARAHFRRAYEKDTTFVTALVWALFTYDAQESRPLLDSVKVRQNSMTPLDNYAVDYFDAMATGNTVRALKAAEAASDIAPRSEWSWNAGALLFPMNRPRETIKYFSRLDPDHGWMKEGWKYYWYLTAQTLHMLGDIKGTHAWLTRARKKFPEDVPIAAAYARSLVLNGQPDSAVAIAKGILQSSVDWKAFYVYSIIEDLRRHGRNREQQLVFDAFSTWYQALGESAPETYRSNFANAVVSMGLDSHAETLYTELVSDFPSSPFGTHYKGNLAVLAARHGKVAEATSLMESVSKSDETWSGEKNYWRARLAAELGDREKAVTLLRAAFDQGYSQISLSHSWWYDFPKLQGYPPFESIVSANR